MAENILNIHVTAQIYVLSPRDFDLFPELKINLIGVRFPDHESLSAAVT